MIIVRKTISLRTTCSITVEKHVKEHQPRQQVLLRCGCCHGDKMGRCQENGQMDGRRGGKGGKVDLLILKGESETPSWCQSEFLIEFAIKK